MKIQYKINSVFCITLIFYVTILVLNMVGLMADIWTIVFGLWSVALYCFVRFKLYESTLSFILTIACVLGSIVTLSIFNIVSFGEYVLYLSYCFITAIGVVGYVLKKKLYVFFFKVNFIGALPMIYYYSVYYNIYTFILQLLIVNITNYMIFKSFKKQCVGG